MTSKKELKRTRIFDPHKNSAVVVDINYLLSRDKTVNANFRAAFAAKEERENTKEQDI